MLQIVGHNALSDFEQHKLHYKLQAICPSISEVTAEYVYFVDLAEPLLFFGQQRLVLSGGPPLFLPPPPP